MRQNQLSKCDNVPQHTILGTTIFLTGRSLDRMPSIGSQLGGMLQFPGSFRIKATDLAKS